MGLSGNRNAMEFSRTYTSRHSTASAVVTHSGSYVTGGVEHGLWRSDSSTATMDCRNPPSTIDNTHEEIQPLAPLSDEISRSPEMTTAPFLSKRWRSDTLQPETPVWRSGTLHFDDSVSMRWRASALKPETPASTAATRRWRAGFLCALRPISSDSTVKRPRLAPDQVMSTTLRKTNVILPLRVRKINDCCLCHGT